MDVTKITNIEIEGIDHTDHPDYCDAFIASADYDGVPMSEWQLDNLNERYADFVYDAVLNFIY